jgi:hypothetical protein
MENTQETEKLISPRGPNGGARPGAGRKPKAEKFKVPIAKAEKKIADKLPWLIDQALELAEGVVVQEFDKEGNSRIYQRPPDMKAIAYLVDRIMGKPTDRRELTLEKPIEEMSDDELRAILES